MGIGNVICVKFGRSNAILAETISAGSVSDKTPTTVLPGQR